MDFTFGTNEPSLSRDDEVCRPPRRAKEAANHPTISWQPKLFDGMREELHFSLSVPFLRLKNLYCGRRFEGTNIIDGQKKSHCFFLVLAAGTAAAHCEEWCSSRADSKQIHHHHRNPHPNKKCLLRHCPPLPLPIIRARLHELRPLLRGHKWVRKRHPSHCNYDKVYLRRKH